LARFDGAFGVVQRPARFGDQMPPLGIGKVGILGKLVGDRLQPFLLSRQEILGWGLETQMQKLTEPIFSPHKVVEAFFGFNI
jgi:hypothetical protein